MTTINVTPDETGPLAPGQDPETGLIAQEGAAPASPESTHSDGNQPPKSPETVEPGNDPAKTENDQENEENQTSRRDALEKTLGASDISLSTLEDEYASSGGFSDASYEALEKAGFPRSVVDAYVAGLEAENMRNVMMQEKEITAVKALAGGDEGYNQLIGWAKGNLSVDEIDGFNAIMETNNPAAIKAAVNGLVARKQMQLGKDPKYLSGSAPGTTAPDAYQSWAEVQRDMSDPKYQNDAAFQKRVAAKLSRSTL